MSDLQIRHEQPADRETIHRLTQEAFAPMPFSEGDEAECIDRLRRDGDLTLSLVGLRDGKIVGHAAFSPVFLDDAFDGWYGLGPVAVWPNWQRSGAGSLLIRQGLGELQAMGARGCILIGDPDYYVRFGFAGDGRITYRDLPAAVVQWLAFGEAKPRGVLKYSPGLE